MTFSQKLINVTLSLGSGQFQQPGGGTGNSTQVTGCRVNAKLSKAAGPHMMMAHVAIFGLPLSQMNQMSTVGTQFDRIYQNKISIDAGDANGMTNVFQGYIATAFVDATAMPQVCFRIIGTGDYFNAAAPAQDTSYSGATAFKTIAKDLAQKMGYTFEDATPSSFNPMLTNPHFRGAYREQMLSAAGAANADWYVDLGKLVITKPGTARGGGGSVTVSKDTILIGYPCFNQNMIVLRTLFDPGLKMGGTINVQSDLTPANGAWVINSIEYNLESMTPHGKWECLIAALPPGQSGQGSSEPGGED